MRRREFVLFFLVLGFIFTVFFHKVIINSYIPFPGDLLINNYSPWKFDSYLGYNPGSYPTKFQYIDVVRQIYPWKIHVINQLKNWQIPLWNPYNFAGMPLMANMQSQVFSPFNLLYFVLPFISGWTLSLVFQIIFAFIFTYLYVRKIGIGKQGALLSSVVYSCSLYMSVFFEYEVFGQTILWLPLALFGVEELLEKLSLRGFFAIVTALSFAAFGGHLQLLSYLFIFTLIYFIFRLLETKNTRSKKAAIILFSFIVSFGIASIQLLPSLELINLAARVSHDKLFFLNNLLKINELIVFISPDFFGNPVSNNYLLNKSYPETALYIGVIPLVFALYAFFLKRNLLTKFYIVASIIVLLMITANPLSIYFYSFSIPFISSSSPTNGIFIISFALSILAGFGLDKWLNEKSNKPLLISISLLLIIFGGFLIHQIMHVSFNSKSIILSVIILAISIALFSLSKYINKKQTFFVLLILITIFDLFYYFQKFNPFVPKELIFPNTKIISQVQKKSGIDRILGYNSSNIQSNTNIIYGFLSPEGYDPLYPKRYGEFLYSFKNQKLLTDFNDSNRSDAAFVNTFNEEDETTFNNKLKILNTLGVKIILDRKENGSTESDFPVDKFKLYYNQKDWKIFENLNSVPRVFLSSEYKVLNNNRKFEEIFFSKSFNPAKTILLEEKPSFVFAKNISSKELVSIKKYEPENIEINVNANSNKLLFLSDMYFPGWNAYVDARQVKILRADYAFRAVEISKGNHIVKFVYRPFSFFLGLWITLLSLIILLIVTSLIHMRILHYEK